jgi:hypothetical protein
MIELVSFIFKLVIVFTVITWVTVLGWGLIFYCLRYYCIPSLRYYMPTKGIEHSCPECSRRKEGVSGYSNPEPGQTSVDTSSPIDVSDVPIPESSGIGEDTFPSSLLEVDNETVDIKKPTGIFARQLSGLDARKEEIERILKQIIKT